MGSGYGTDVPAEAVALVQHCDDRGRWAGTSTDGHTFAVFGTVRQYAVWAVLAEHVPGEQPEIGLHARWLYYPGRGWRWYETVAYRAALTTPGDVLNPDPPRTYRDAVLVSKHATFTLASADDPAAVWEAVTHLA